ncbi:MAG TPA: hypothetical protein VHF92_13855 [Geodermatophilus sp.]|nr:hypothetical protein [Geodermatophilus sp.]
MTTMADSLLDTIHLEFDLACQDLAQAKLAQRTKDTLAARAQVAACRDRVDALLDMWNSAELRS